jgi:lysozyme
MTVRGVDVSRWQGDYTWPRDISFGMCKATEGTGYTDPELGRNWDAMWELREDRRLPRFAYHFFHAALDPVRQAEFFILTVKQHGLLPGDNLVADFEATDPDSGLNDGVTPEVFAARGEEFLHTVNELAPGHRILPYADPSFAAAGNCSGMAAWYLWVADYGVPQPAVPRPWDRWTFWQDDASPVDTDQFNGTGEQLLAFTRMPDKR